MYRPSILVQTLTAPVMLFVLLMAIAPPVLAHGGGAIYVAGDEFGGGCEVPDSGPGIQTVWVFHAFNIGVIASRFRVEAQPGTNMTYVSETHHFATTSGNTQDGISVCYDECTVVDALLVTITYMRFAPAEGCSKVLVMPHPDAETIDVINCDGVAVYGNVQDLTYSAGSGCGCFPRGILGTPVLFDCTPVPVTPTTWGAVKALYAD